MSRPPTPLRPRRALLMLAAGVFLALVLLGPLLSANPVGKSTGEGSAVRQLGYITVFLLAATAVRPLRAPTRLLVMPVSLALVLIWCWLSIGWAVDPGVSLRRLLLMTMVVWTIFLTVNQLGYESTTHAIRVALIGVLIANFSAVILAPEVGIHMFDVTGDPGLVGDWRGITTHKNFAGAICAFTVILFLLDGHRLKALPRWSAMIGAAFFLYKSGSKTSMGILVLALGCGSLYLLYRPRHRVLVMPAVTLASLSFVVMLQSYWGRLEAAMNNPYALTGRAQIWPVMTAYIGDHWLLGSGYGSFWNIGSSSPVYRYASDWVSELASGHNGYLDVMAQLGLPGLLLAVSAVLVLPLARLLFNDAVSRPQGALLLTLIVFCAGHNLTESSLLDRDAFVQVMLMYAIALIAPASMPVAQPLPFRGEARATA